MAYKDCQKCKHMGGFRTLQGKCVTGFFVDIGGSKIKNKVEVKQYEPINWTKL